MTKPMSARQRQILSDKAQASVADDRYRNLITGSQEEFDAWLREPGIFEDVNAALAEFDAETAQMFASGELPVAPVPDATEEAEMSQEQYQREMEQRAQRLQDAIVRLTAPKH